MTEIDAAADVAPVVSVAFGTVAQSNCGRAIASRALEEIAATGLVPTVRELSDLTGAKTGVVTCALQESGIHPKRDARIAALRPKVRQFLELFERSMPMNAERVCVFDEITAEALGTPASESSRRVNRSRFKERCGSCRA